LSECGFITILEKIIALRNCGLTGTKLNEIMHYRCSKPGKDKTITKLKRIWALPVKKSTENKAARERFNKLLETKSE